MNEMEERKWLKKKEKALLDGNYENIYYACKELADIYVNQEDYQQALSQYEQCEEAANRCGDEIRLGVANRMIGEMYCYLNDFKNAIKHQKLHLKISNSKNDVVEQQRALATLGRTYFLLSETLEFNMDNKSEVLNTSVKYYLKSLEVCNKLGKEVGTKTLSEMKARLYLNLSLCEESSNELNKSMDYINKAMKLCSDSDLNEELCKCYSIKSTLYSKQDNFSKAISCVDQGLQIASRLSNKKYIGTELLCLKAELLIDINPKLISYISNQGYLKCIISSLLESDSELKDLISAKNKTLKPIYVYENKMVNLFLIIFKYFFYNIYIILI